MKHELERPVLNWWAALTSIRDQRQLFFGTDITHIDSTIDWIVISGNILRLIQPPCRPVVSSSLKHLSAIRVRKEKRLCFQITIELHDDLFANAITDVNWPYLPFELSILFISIDPNSLTDPIIINLMDFFEEATLVNSEVLSCQTSWAIRLRSKYIGSGSLKYVLRVIAWKCLSVLKY